MPIKNLRISQFRNLHSVAFTPAEGVNLFYGENGSGKTSLLEAIYYLSVGRSFRSSSATRLIQQTTDKFSIYLQWCNVHAVESSIGCERTLQGLHQLRLAEKEVSLAEVAQLLPLRLMNSQAHQLLEAGPIYRRKYLDWGLFYQEPSFLSIWRHYERILKQRNAVLRDKRSRAEWIMWTEQLIQYGKALENLRQQYVHSLSLALQPIAHTLLPWASLTLAYQPGWPSDPDMAFFERHFAEEQRLGHTQFGPHRADLAMEIEGQRVQHFLSRGQQKLLVCAMMIAQGKLLIEQTKQGLIYLIDDLPSELDSASQYKLMTLLFQQQTQIFMTAIDREKARDFGEIVSPSVNVFHVKHGEVHPCRLG